MTNDDHSLVAVWEPEIFCLDSLSKQENQRLKEYLNNPNTQIFDSLDSQLGEYLKAKNPSKKLKNDSLKEAVKTFYEENSKDTFGNWVYYPWSNRLVRTLPEEEFIFTRTSANVPKITRDELALLRTKKVGVVGLSVGQSVSLVLSMERICGELRIADFDELELANLNRIRTGLHTMGVNKTVAVAREIKEIDPYFIIRCFPDGMTQENMESFFHEGGDLDLIVDECDSIDIKIELRKKAKSMLMPVVMDMSDKGTLDVERFDLEPDRKILHGWLEHLDYSNLGSLSNEEKVPFMMPIFGIDTISKRLKASMVEIGQTIHTWPQLATAVAMGGALAADTIRRIFLNQFHDSGRYFIDLDTLIRDKDYEVKKYSYQKFDWPELEKEKMLQLAKNLSIPKAQELSEARAEELVKLALLAPSAGNNQPWKWLYWNNSLFLFHDKIRSYSWTDFDDSMAFISLGTAIEAMNLAADSFGLKASVIRGDESTFPLIAAFQFDVSDQPASSLSHGLKLRCSNRKKGDNTPFDRSLATTIRTSIEDIKGAQFDFIDEQAKIDQLAEIVARAEKIRFLNPQGHHEFFVEEMRWTPKQAEESKDGLDLRTYELGPSDITGLEVVSDPEVLDLINQWKGGKGIEKVSREAVKASSAIGLITMPDISKGQILSGGQAAMRAWILTNQNEWNVQPISAPLFFINRKSKPNHLLSEENIQEIEAFEKELYQIMPILQTQRGIFMFRLAKADKPSELALRRDIEQIYLRG